MRRALLGAAVVAVIAGLAVYFAHGASDEKTRPTTAKVPDKAVGGASAPAAPRVRAPSPGLVLRADVAGELSDVAPGAVAFRKYTDDFVDAQADAVQAHMARERLTLDETRELTYFAVLAVESQDWARVESLTGKPLSPESRREVWESMMARSQEVRRHLQKEIAAGSDEGTRWETIARVESDYLGDYYRITGMTPALLDQLLLASVRDQRVNQTIASLSPDNDRPPVPPGSKPGAFVKRDPLHPDRPPVPVDQQPPP